jgi:hypothetical protein
MSFAFRLELANGEPAEPPTFVSSESNGAIFLGPRRRLQASACTPGQRRKESAC